MQTFNRNSGTEQTKFGATNKHTIFMPLRLSGGNNSATYNQDNNSIELQLFPRSAGDHESIEDKFDQIDGILRCQTYGVILLNSRKVENRQIVKIIKDMY